MRPGSTMEVCVRYSGGSYSGSVYSSAFTWGTDGQSLPPHNLSVSATPSDFSTLPGQSGVVKFTLRAGQASTGFYGLKFLQPCGSFPVAVGYGPSEINASDFPGLFRATTCLPGFSGTRELTGYTGGNLTQVTLESKFNVGHAFNITDKSVSSFPTPAGDENITFRMTVHSFNKPITVGLSLNQSFIREFVGDPQLRPAPGDPNQTCSWWTNNVFEEAHMKETSFQDLPPADVQLNAPVLQLGPNSTSAYSFSILVASSIAKNMAVDPILYVDAPNYDGHGMATFFPVSVAGQLQTISGPCDSQQG